MDLPGPGQRVSGADPRAGWAGWADAGLDRIELSVKMEYPRR